MRRFLRRLIPFIAAHKGRLVQAAVCSVVAAASGGALMFLIENVLDDIFINKDRDALMILPGIVILLYLLQGGSRYIQTVQMAYVGEEVVRRIRDLLLASLLNLDLAFFNKYRGGELISRVTNDINRIRLTVSEYLGVVARESLFIVALIFVAVYKSPKLAFFGLIVIPAAAYPLAMIANRIRKLAHRSQEKDSDITSRLSEIFNNMEIIKAHSSERFEGERFERDNLEFRRINMKGVRARELASPLMEFLGSFAVAGVIIVGGLQVIEGHLTPGRFSSFAAALFMIYTPLKRISVIYNKMFEAVAASERIFDMIARKPAIASGERRLDEPVRSLELVDVHLDYGGAPALKGVNLTTRSGETLALVGDSGGGKTSLVNLILRLYDPSRGEVLLNGIDMRELDLSHLRSKVGIVTQRVYIFNDTIAANVAYGNEIDRERVTRALHQAGAWEFVSRLENGIDSVIDEFGANLSGGQRQRLAIARAIYKQPEILILDEATSALDNRSEAAVQKALHEIIRDKIAIIIAHRLSTVDLAHRILVIQDGRVIGAGTKEELMRDCAEYRRLVAGKAPRDPLVERDDTTAEATNT